MHYTPLYDSICTSARMADLPDMACRYFYVCLLAKCDSWGRLDARPRKLNVEVWPLLGQSDEETARALNALIQAGLVEVYWPQGGDPFIQVPDWEEKAGSVGRKSHRRASKFPDPASLPNCKVPGEPGDAGRSRAERASPGGAGRSISGAGARVGASLGGEPERGPDQAAPGVSENAAHRTPRRRPAASAEQVASRVEFAAFLQHSAAQAAWEAWLDWCGTAGARAKPPVGPQAARILNAGVAAGPARFAEAVDYAIAGNYLQPTYRSIPSHGNERAPSRPRGMSAIDSLERMGEAERAARSAGSGPRLVGGA